MNALSPISVQSSSKKVSQELLSINDLEEGARELSIMSIKKQFDKIFVSGKKTESTHCIKDIQDYSIAIFSSSKMEAGMYILSIGSWVLLTIAASMQLYYNFKENSASKGSTAVIGIGIVALVIQGIVAGLWCIHTKIKGKVDDEKRDKQLIDKFVEALKEHKIASIETPPTIESLHPTHLRPETQDCIKQYDNLPSRIKEKIPPRDLWIIGLIKGLPVNHPLQDKLQRMLSTASQLQDNSRGNELFPEGEEANSLNSDCSQKKGKELKPDIHEVFKADLREIEDFIGSPTNIWESVSKK